MTYPADHYFTVTEEEFPHGVKCSECKCEIFPGQMFMPVPEGMIEATPVEVLVCVFCATLG
jgi:hypothetical protein